MALVLALAVCSAAQSAAPVATNAAADTNAPRNLPPGFIPPPAGHKFTDGLALTYSVEWRLFNAGTATFRMDAAGREQRVVATADAAGVVAMLYHVQDRFESFFDPTSFCSRSVKKHTEEGFRKLDTSITFDYQRKKSVLNERNLKNDKSKQQENDIPECVTDVVSAVYYVASLPLTAGAVQLFPINDGGKTLDAKATVEAREEVTTPAGRFKTVRVQITSDSKSIKNRGQIWIWYTDNAARTPVQMKSRLFWGNLTFRLQRAELPQAK